MSRRFAIIKPEDLWTGPLARQFRQHPATVRELFAYLLTGPTTDHWGIWHLEMDTIVLQTGRKDVEVVKALEVLAAMRLAFFDVRTEFVYLPTLPETQFIRWPLMPGDNNVRHAKRWYAALERNPFLGDWFDRHLEDLFLLRDPDACTRREWTPEDAPPPAEDLLGPVPETLPVRSSRRVGMPEAELEAAYQRIEAMYPKKAALHLAKRALKKLNPTTELLGLIFQALEWQVRQPDWLKENANFCPRLDRYFEQRRWMDKPSRVPNVNTGTAQIMTGMSDFIDYGGEPECTTPEKNVRALPKRSGG